MTNYSEENSRFTAGDNFIGLHRLYHEAMMNNELRNGYGAYELSYAGGKSGFSFGGNQMDMSKKKKETIKLFIDILNNANDSTGNKILTKDEINTIVGDKNVNLKTTGQSLENVFGKNLLSINMALSCEYGKKVINQAYFDEIKSGADHIENVIQKIQNPAAKKFYDSDLGRTLLFDYHNQFGLKLDNTFIKEYVDGKLNNKERTHYKTKEKIVAPLDTYTFEHHREYIRSTKQWYECEQKHLNENTINNSENRLNNIEKILQAYQKDDLDKVLRDSISKEQVISHDFAFSWNKDQKKWQIVYDIYFPEFEVPAPRGHTVVAKVENIFLSRDTPLKADVFYYKATSMRLFHITSAGSSTLPPGADNFRMWSPVKYILLPREQMLYIDHPGAPNIANYIVFLIKVKELSVEKTELLSWLRDDSGEILQPVHETDATAVA